MTQRQRAWSYDSGRMSNGPFRRAALSLVVAGAVFAIALDGGGYALESRGFLAVSVWWTILVTVGLRLLPLTRPPRAAVLAGGLLAGLAVWALASLLWADSAERVFNEFNRDILYLGVFVLVVLATKPGHGARWLDGLAIGITAVGLLALAQRFFPDLIAADEIPTFLPAAAARLSYPLAYWNGLAILLALAVPLLLRSAVFAGRAWARALAVAPLPALAVALYLTSSRGGVLAALVGALAFLAVGTRRWGILGAGLVAAAGSIAALAVLLPRDELVNGPIDSDAAASQGWGAAVLIALLCGATGLAYGLAERLVAGRVRPPRAAGWALTLLAAAVVAGAIAAADPAERLERFKKPPDAVLLENPDFARAHLASGSGSGRWQYWNAAVDEFESAPALGGGAGSYEAWWTQKRPIAQPVRDAHSLYLETLGELGIVGFVLVLGIVGMGLVSGFRRSLRADAGGVAAAASASFAAYAVGAGVDWMWELTAVSLVGIVALAVVTGPATGETPPPAAARLSPRIRLAAGAAAFVAVWALLSAQAVPLLADAKIEDSQAAVRRGDGRAALEDARAARNIQPWAATPYLQLALVEEQVGELDSARAHIGEAIDRDPRDWRLWLIASRIETKTGEVPAARRSLARARELNPRSPLLTELGG